MPLKIEAVFLDLYETLISEFQDGRRKVSAPAVHDALGMAAETYQQAWRARLQRRMDGSFPDYASALRDIAAEAGLAPHESVIEVLRLARIRQKRVPFDGILPELPEVLWRLKQCGIKLGLVSNCAPEEVEAWAESPFYELFDDTVFSYQVRLAKPDPGIYMLACSRLGVDPSRAAFVGDGGANELSGARTVGMTAYQAVWFWCNPAVTGFPRLRAPVDLLTAAWPADNVDGE